MLAHWHPDVTPHVLASLTDEPEAYLDGAYYTVDGAMPGPKLYDLDDVRELPGVGERHPVAWGRRTGRDVGPSIDVATRTVGFANLLRRGTEWGATGPVTIPVVDDVEAAAPA